MRVVAADGWQEWSGLPECGPNLGSGDIIEVKWRDGETHIANGPYDRPLWWHTGGSGDVVAYRVVRVVEVVAA